MILLLAFACNGDDNFVYSGFDMVDHFPMDGKTRTWRYSNSAYQYNLDVEMVGETEVIGGQTVHTFEYYSAANGNLLWDTKYSADTINGVHIYSYTVYSEDGGGQDTGTDDTGNPGGPEESMTFDPPLQLAEDQMVPGASVVTDTGGLTWTATLQGQVECPNDWVSGERTWKCLYVTLDDGDGDDLTGPKVAGHYWLAPRYGMSWFQQSGDTDKWVLGEAYWEPN